MTISAQEFKNKYTSEIINNDLANKLGMERAKLASTIQNIDTGESYYINDGIPANTLVAPSIDAARTFVDESSRWPIKYDSNLQNKEEFEPILRSSAYGDVIVPSKQKGGLQVGPFTIGGQKNTDMYSKSNTPSYWRNDGGVSEAIAAEQLAEGNSILPSHPLRRINNYEKSFLNGATQFEKIK